MGTGFFRSLSQGYFHRWEPGRRFLILTAYLDESGTHGGSDFTVMAGYVGLAAEWEKFETRWEGLLRREEVPYLHSQGLIHGKSPFKGWSEDRRRRVIDEAREIIADHHLFGVSAVLRNDDYQTVYRAPPQLRRLRLDTKYGLCFRTIFKYILQMLEQQEAGWDGLTVVLESGHKNAGDAVRIFDVFKEHGPAHQTGRVQPLSFAKKRDAGALQAADLLAFPVLHTEIRQAVEVADSDPGSITDLRAHNDPVFRVPIDRQVLAEERGVLLADLEHKRAHWHKPKAVATVTSSLT